MSQLLRKHKSSSLRSHDRTRCKGLLIHPTKVFDQLRELETNRWLDNRTYRVKAHLVGFLNVPVDATCSYCGAGNRLLCPVAEGLLGTGQLHDLQLLLCILSRDMRRPCWHAEHPHHRHSLEVAHICSCQAYDMGVSQKQGALK